MRSAGVLRSTERRGLVHNPGSRAGPISVRRWPVAVRGVGVENLVSPQASSLGSREADPIGDLVPVFGDKADLAIDDGASIRFGEFVVVSGPDAGGEL